MIEGTDYVVAEFKYRTVRGKRIQTSYRGEFYLTRQPRGVAYLHVCGGLNVETGYRWDGPSGPAIDTESTMAASLVHDILYQMIREGTLPMKFRKTADRIYRELLRKGGVSRTRAWYHWAALRAFGRGAI